MARNLMLLALLMAAPLMADDQTLTERSQARARAILDSAVAAAGGEEALLGIETVRIQADGRMWAPLQTPSSMPPFEPGFQTETVHVDLKGNALNHEYHFDRYGLRSHYTAIVQGAEGTLYDHVLRTLTPLPAAQANDRRVRAYRRLPHLLLRHALSSPTSLRYAGEAKFEGKLHQVITLVTPDAQPLALYVDETSGLVSKYETVVVDLVKAEAAVEVLFGGYARAGKLLLPTTTTTRQAGQVVAELRLRTEINPASVSGIPASAQAYTRAEPLNPAPTVAQLGEGVHLLMNVAAPDYNILVVEFADHLLVIDAPVSAAATDRVISRVKSLLPQKPVRYVALTHHHGDHIGGVRSFIAEGSTILTTPGNRALIESIAAAKHRDRLSTHPRALQLLLVQHGKHVLQDASQTVELIDVGPHPHAKEVLIVYLPRQRLVFQGDLFFGSAIAFAITHDRAAAAELARKLRVLNLTVDTVAGTHGKTVSWDAFTADVEAPPEMRAVRMHAYGGPEVLRVDRVPVPEPEKGQVRVRVHAAAVNPIDWKIRQGRPGQTKPASPRTPGFDVAGVVDAVGAGVTEWRKGDEVIAALQHIKGGGYADYAIAPSDDLARKPARMSFVEASGIPTVGLTAWHSLVDVARLSTKDRVLVHGGAGGVGSMAVQIAKAHGAHVIATASARNHDYVRSIGASELIDYSKVAFEQAAKDVDVVFDTVGGDTLARSYVVLRNGGRLVSIAGRPDAANCEAMGIECRIGGPTDEAFGPSLTEVVKLIEAGKLTMHVDQVFPLEYAAQAQELNRGGHTRGKIVLGVADGG